MQPRTENEPTTRSRRSRSLTYAGLAGVVMLYLFSLAQASRSMPAADGAWPGESVVWGGIAAASCVVAAILLFLRAFLATTEPPQEGPGRTRT